MIGVATFVFGLIVLVIIGRKRRRDSESEFREYEQNYWLKNLEREQRKKA